MPNSFLTGASSRRSRCLQHYGKPRTGLIYGLVFSALLTHGFFSPSASHTNSRWLSQPSCWRSPSHQSLQFKVRFISLESFGPANKIYYNVYSASLPTTNLVKRQIPGTLPSECASACSAYESVGAVSILLPFPHLCFSPFDLLLHSIVLRSKRS